MVFTKKLDRAFQWAGERMGVEAKTSYSEEFKQLDAEMVARHEGVDRLQRSSSSYVKWFSRRGEVLEDGQKGAPAAHLGHNMIRLAQDLDSSSELAQCLIVMGRAEERLASAQGDHVEAITTTWLASVDRSVAMMKEYQAARKKLEARRMTLEVSTGRKHKARCDDFRIDEELRAACAKFDESTQDVSNRMKVIQDADQDSVRGLTAFLDAELNYHQRCLDELHRIRAAWPASENSGPKSSRSHSRSASIAWSDDRGPRLSAVPSTESIGSHSSLEATRPKLPDRSQSQTRPPPPLPPLASSKAEKPPLVRASMCHQLPGPPVAEPQPVMVLVSQLTPRQPYVPGSDSRFALTPVLHRDDNGRIPANITADEDESPTTTQTGRSASPVASDGLHSTLASPSTSMTSLRSTLGHRRAPPPPPPSCNKKPGPPIPKKSSALCV